MDQIGQVLLAVYEWFRLHQDHFLWGAYVLAGISAAVILLRFCQGKWILRRGCLYQIAVPQGADVMPFAAEQMFAALHDIQESWPRRLLHGFDHISLEIAADHTGIRFYLWTPARIADTVVRLIHSAYGQADIQLLEEDYLKGPGKDALELPHSFPNVNSRHSRMCGARMVLRNDVSLPIKTLREFEKTDPLAAITAVMAGLREGEGMVMQLLILPGGDWELARRAKVQIDRVERKRSVSQPTPDGQRVLKAVRDYTPEEQQRVKSIGGKRAKLSYRVSLRLLVVAPTRRQAYARLRGLAASFGQFHVATLNGFRRRTVWFAKRALFLRHMRNRAFPLWGRHKLHRPLTGEHDVLTIEELSSLWHLPHPEVVETPGIIWSFSRKRAVARTIKESRDGLVIARTTYRGERWDIALPIPALYRHVTVTGLPGAGKSTLLAWIALECIERGIGLVLLDPHGDLCEDLLPRIPGKHHARVIYFNPAKDLDRPIGLNLIAPEPSQRSALIKSEVVAMLVHLFGRQMIGPRSEYVLANAILTLQEVGGMTLLEISNLLNPESTLRDRALLYVRNPATLDFWSGYFLPTLKSNKRLLMDVISPVKNKIGAFASDPCVAHIIGQARSSFHLRDVLDSGKVLICNLSQGALGLDNARLLGGAIVSRTIQAAMAREKVPIERRRPALLIADEFHIFIGPAFPHALAQMRKYRLGLILACQMLSQLEELPGLKSAVLSTGTLCVFKAAAEDGNRLSIELTGFFKPEDLVRMDHYQVAIRMGLGHETIPFSGETIPLEEWPTFDPASAESLRLTCRRKYGRPVDEVKQEILSRSRLRPPKEQDVELVRDGQSSSVDEEVYDVPCI